MPWESDIIIDNVFLVNGADLLWAEELTDPESGVLLFGLDLFEAVEVGVLREFDGLARVIGTIPGYMFPLKSLISRINFSLTSNLMASPKMVSFSFTSYGT